MPDSNGEGDCITCARDKVLGPNVPADDAPRPFDEVWNSRDELDRTARYINGLSPHNLWKAKPALQQLIGQSNRNLLNRILAQRATHLNDQPARSISVKKVEAELQRLKEPS